MASEELKGVLELLRAAPPLPAGASIEQMRAGMEQMTAMAPLPEDVSYEAVDAGGVPAEWAVAPNARADRSILYLHGGGYVVGSVRTHRQIVGNLSRAAAARVLSVDYRLAPENPHPAAVEDATAAYRHLLESVEPTGAAIAGDSAGGGLTAAALIALREAGAPLPAAGVLISPWLDLTQSGESMVTRAEADPMVQRDGLQMMADAYVAGADAKAPTVSPLFADLAGLPPLLVHIGTAETLLDDSTRFARRAEAAGVDVDLEVWDDMIHVWHAFATVLPEAREAIDRIGQYLQDRWS
jgi:epsilon-lactone hydrolase